MLDWLLSMLEKQFKTLVPEKDKKGVYKLSFGLKHPVLVQDLNPGVFFFSRLIPPPEKGREDLFIYLMKANFLFQGTGGSVIGLDKDEKFLTLSLTLPYEVNYNIFRESLEDFLNYIEYWQEEINKHKNV